MKNKYVILFLFLNLLIVLEKIHADFPSDSLSILYSKAIQDAKNPEPDEIYDNLLVIIGNPNLIDTLINGEKYILTVSWKSASTAALYPDSGIMNTKKWPIWISVVPEVQNKCKEYFEKLTNPNLRIRQLLGLQPDAQYDYFVEFWVKPADLFRPCPDNETSDSKCGLNLPPNVTNEYRRWFNDLRAVQYVDCYDTTYKQLGWPWTQLGYTYDWNSGNTSNVGVSEFVIPGNKNIYVRRKYKTEEYCSKN
ncbi:MAG: hypothetical protein PVH88_14115 [Ignavibacteria bacterium]